jgi:hypothetical protein
MNNRVASGELSREDKLVLVAQLRHKALEHARSLVQDRGRDRGGRSR